MNRRCRHRLPGTGQERHPVQRVPQGGAELHSARTARGERATRSRARAFTLMEILVVVVIVAIIAAIGFPAIGRIKARADSMKCAGKLRDIGVAVHSYMGDHGLRFPELVAARESRSEDAPAMDNVLDEYLPDERAFQCPSDHGGIWEKTGSSYFWNSLLNKQVPGSVDFLGLRIDDTGIPVASDKENFHENIGDEVNILYADGHVLRELQFQVVR